MKRDVSRGFSGTDISVKFGLVENPTTLNRISMTALHHIMNPLFVSLDMFDVLPVHNNDVCIGYQIADITPFMPMRLYKRHNLS